MFVPPAKEDQIFLVLQEQNLIDTSSKLDQKIQQLIHETESGRRPTSELDTIKNRMDELLAQAHTSKEELLHRYESEHSSESTLSNKDSAGTASDKAGWAVAPKQDQNGQDLPAKPVRCQAHAIHLQTARSES